MPVSVLLNENMPLESDVDPSKLPFMLILAPGMARPFVSFILPDIWVCERTPVLYRDNNKSSPGNLVFLIPAIRKFAENISANLSLSVSGFKYKLVYIVNQIKIKRPGLDKPGRC
jgi:hypothetical protein